MACEMYVANGVMAVMAAGVSVVCNERRDTMKA